MPYCRGPYAAHSSLPSPDVTSLASSRNVDLQTRRYTFDSDGNPETMPTTRQRVVFAIAAAGPIPKFITDRDIEQRKAVIRAGLAYLVSEGAITLDRIVIENPNQGHGREFVYFTDLNTGVDDYVTNG